MSGKIIEGMQEVAEHTRVRSAIFAWIRDDVGMAAKMTITPEIVDKLTDRIVGTTTHHPHVSTANEGEGS